MNKSKWFYCFNADDGDDFTELNCEVSENPNHDELDEIAQTLLFDYGYTDEDDYISIGKGELVTIESIGGCIGEEIVEMLEATAANLYDCEEFFSSAKKEDIADLDRRIEQTLKEWEEERNVMSSYYTIPDTKRYYYHGDKCSKEDQK